MLSSSLYMFGVSTDISQPCYFVLEISLKERLSRFSMGKLQIEKEYYAIYVHV